MIVSTYKFVFFLSRCLVYKRVLFHSQPLTPFRSPMKCPPPRDVRRGVIWGSSIHSIHKGEILCDESMFDLWFLLCTCSGVIYRIELKTLVWIPESIFYLVVSRYTFVFSRTRGLRGCTIIQQCKINTPWSSSQN